MKSMEEVRGQLRWFSILFVLLCKHSSMMIPIIWIYTLGDMFQPTSYLLMAGDLSTFVDGVERLEVEELSKKTWKCQLRVRHQGLKFSRGMLAGGKEEKRLLLGQLKLA